MTAPVAAALRAPKPPVRPISIILLVVGILAVLTSIIPWVGLVVGVVGLVLFIVSRVLGTPGLMSVIGGVLAVLGAAANVVVLLVVAFVFPAIGSYVAHQGYDDGAGENSKYDEDYDLSSDYLISTPCFSFTGPEGWINKQNDYFDADCLANLVDHGPLDASGRYQFDYDDYGAISVTPDVDPSGSSSSTGTDSVELDGQEASLDRSTTADGTMAVLTLQVEMPEQRSNYSGEFDALTIVIAVTPDTADEILDELVGTWTWN